MTDYPMTDKINIGECRVHLWARRHQKETDSVPILKYVLPVEAAPIKFITWMGRTECHTFFCQLMSKKKGGEGTELFISPSRISFEIIPN